MSEQGDKWPASSSRGDSKLQIPRVPAKGVYASAESVLSAVPLEQPSSIETRDHSFCR